MIWFLILHIMALLFWCATLLYLPTLLAVEVKPHSENTHLIEQHGSVARYLFTHLATPAAVIAVIAGTLVFLIDTNIEVWLIVKLTLVALLVVCHAFTGMLILRAETQWEPSINYWCWLLEFVLCVLMVAIIWLVLAKPSVEALLP